MNMGFVPVLVRCDILAELDKKNERNELYDSESFINDILQRWLDMNYQEGNKKQKLEFNEAARRWLMSRSRGGI